MKFNPFKSKKIKKPQKPAKIKIAGEKSKDKNESAERVNRTVYLTVAVLLIVLAVAVAMTSAANRARRGQAENTDPAVTTSPTPENTSPRPEVTSPKEENTDPPAETQTPESTKNNNVTASAAVPTLSLPVNGCLGKEHDPTVQVFSNTLGEWRVHLGIDIMTEAAAPVYPAAKGKIKQISDDPMWGKCIWIEHDGDAVSVYRGLADELPDGIEVGAKVNEDTLIGAVGDGGVLELADEPHLHFEMKVAGADVDPIEYFSKSALETLSKNKDTTYEG